MSFFSYTGLNCLVPVRSTVTIHYLYLADILPLRGGEAGWRAGVPLRGGEAGWRVGGVAAVGQSRRGKPAGCSSRSRRPASQDPAPAPISWAHQSFLVAKQSNVFNYPHKIVIR